MTFIDPLWLLLLVPVAAVAVAYVVMLQRRRRYAVRFAALPMLDRVVPRRPGWRRHLPAVAILLAFVTLSMAIARPEIAVKVPRERATVMVAIDTSASMQATDVPPTRLTAAIAAATRFLDELPPTFNVGVVSFARTARLVAPPSTDREAAKAGVRALGIESATAVGEAVFSSLDAIASIDRRLDLDGDPTTPPEPVPGRIVLLSDGSTTVGRSPAEAALASVAADVEISTIAYGTPGGVLDTGSYDLPVPVDTATLEQLAVDTGGQAYTAETSGELEDVYRDIGSSIGFRTEIREVTTWFAVSGLLLGLLAAVMSLRWFSRLI